MSDQSPPSTNPKRATLYTILVTVAVLLIWFGTTTCVGSRLPEMDRAFATALAATETAVADILGDPEATAEPAPVSNAAAAANPAAAPTAKPSATVAPAPTRTPRRQATETARPTNTPRPLATSTPTFPAIINGLPTISWSALPEEAQETLRLIDQGGPFPFDRDGITFQNREGLLPNQPRNYYREYTVITPGERDRGARRIVTGDDGELYYTDDHYDSFSYVVR